MRRVDPTRTGKPKTSEFCEMRSALDDLGMVTAPASSDHRIASCASVTLPPAVKSIPRAPVYLLYRIPR